MRFLLPLMLCAVLAPAAQAQNVDLANIREDMRLMVQRVNELSARVEQLERENSNLRSKVALTEDTVVTLKQLNEAVTDINRSIQTQLANSRNEVLQQVSRQLETMAKQTNAAIDAVSRNAATRAPVQTTFSDNFPKDGISYTVQRGDSLAVIVTKTGARKQDIINANRITDENVLQVGQVLFIPGARAVK